MLTTHDRISTAEAARLYRIPARTIRRWHDEGRITDPVTQGGKHMWLEDEIDQLCRLRAGHRLPRAPQMTHPDH